MALRRHESQALSSRHAAMRELGQSRGQAIRRPIQNLLQSLRDHRQKDRIDSTTSIKLLGTSLEYFRVANR
eukprot:Skav213981  [mRNA]  locus=scaffold2200:524839:527295:+ [translate_table: standard]